MDFNFHVYESIEYLYLKLYFLCLDTRKVRDSGTNSLTSTSGGSGRRADTAASWAVQ